MQNRTKKIVVNTIVLYAKVIISLLISLLTTRIVLSSLGVEDFGLYNLVVGLVAMISFVNLAMTTSTLRYNAYYLNKPEANEIVNDSIILHLLLAGIVFILLELFGLYFIRYSLNITEEQTEIVNIIFQFVVFGCIMQIITVPYDALINVHEDMVTFSVIAIFESLLRLSAACLLFCFTTYKLIFYSLFISLIPLLTFVIKRLYCRKNYREVKPLSLRIINKIRFKEMGIFAFWNMFGAFSNTAKNQGIAMVLNVFFGVVVNAAYGISQQINSLCLILSGSLQKSINPVILKSEGNGDRFAVIKYGLTQCRISVFLVALIVVPIYFNLPCVLQLWLGDFPKYTVELCRWLIVLTVITQLTTGIQVAIQSTGKIKFYQITMSILILLNIPLSIIFLKLGFSPEIVFKVGIAVELLCVIVRIVFARNLVGLKFYSYFQEVILPFLSIIIAFLLSAILSNNYVANTFFETIVKFCMCFLIVVLCVYCVGLKKEEKVVLMQIIKSKLI